MELPVTEIRTNRVASNDPVAAQPAGVGLADLLDLVRRNALLIGAITLALTLLAAAVLSRIEPRYSAQSLLMLDSRGNQLVNLNSVMTGMPGDAEGIQSEIEVLRSGRLANMVITELGLDGLREFNEALADGAAAPSPAADDAGAANNFMIEGDRVGVIEKFRERLDVEPKPGSRVIAIDFSSHDPRLAATIANAVADLYLRDQLETKFEAIQRATDWLNERVAELREKVERSERAVEAYREQSGLLEGGGVTLTEQEISDLNAQLISARSARNEAEARLRQIRRLIRSADGAASAGEVLGSSLIQRLREQQTSIQREVAELSTEFGDSHPRMIKLRAEAADLKTRIEAEIQKIVDGLDYEVAIARARESSLAAAVGDAKERVGEANRADVGLRALEREAQANRLLLETMLARFTETSAQDDMASQQPDARVISRAVVPDEPSYPMKKAILVLVFVAAAFLALMIAFIREFMDKGYRAGEQIEMATGVRSLGFVPKVGRKALGGEGPADYFLTRGTSAFAESIRSFQVGLATEGAGRRPRTILVTSSQAGEGKTTVSVCLARLMATAGQRVLIIDADCRRPAVHAAMGVKSKPGLTDVLAGKARVNDVVVSDTRTGASILPAGRSVSNPPATLQSPRTDELLRTLAARYDCIVIDSPPIMAVSDALMLTRRVDATVVVAKWGDTRRESVRLALKRIANAGGQVSGVLLSMVNVRQYARYGYGDSGSYAGRLADYHEG